MRKKSLNCNILYILQLTYIKLIFLEIFFYKIKDGKNY